MYQHPGQEVELSCRPTPAARVVLPNHHPLCLPKGSPPTSPCDIPYIAYVRYSLTTQLDIPNTVGQFLPLSEKNRLI